MSAAGVAVTVAGGAGASCSRGGETKTKPKGREVYICGAVRTPIGKGRKSGALYGMHPAQLFAATLAELVERTGVDVSAIDDVVGGVVTPVGRQGANVPRLAALAAGFPVSVPGVQLNRMCGSGQQAVHFGAAAIGAGDMEVVVAGGVEMMSTEKMASDVSMEGMGELVAAGFPHRLLHQGMSAELVAEKYGITRQEADDLAAESHRRAAHASKHGYFESQMFPVRVEKEDGSEVVLDRDEGVRESIDPAKMAGLKTVFKAENGVVTAGNASQISDGAAALLLASGEAAEALGLRKRARFVARVVVGSDPEVMLDGVIPATEKALAIAGLGIEDIDAFEVNEAFATVVLAWVKTFKPSDGLARVNPDGGAIAHGHPLGASGAVLMTKLVSHLERVGGRYGLQVMCIGHGQATCTVVECLRGSKL